MNNLMRNLENVLDRATSYLVESKELKTLMNTYRTLLQRVPSRDISVDHLKRFDEQKEKLKSTLSSVEWKIDDKLRKNDYKAADDYAEVTYRISKALVDINSILRHRPFPRHAESITEDLEVKNSKASLSQLPIKRDKVRILHSMINMYEVAYKDDIKENGYYVDYEFGDVYFHKNNEGDTFKIAYFGKGGNLKSLDM